MDWVPSSSPLFEGRCPDTRPHRQLLLRGRLEPLGCAKSKSKAGGGGLPGALRAKSSAGIADAGKVAGGHQSAQSEKWCEAGSFVGAPAGYQNDIENDSEM
jgi:hypothetical protein